jgi:hypothetical protein
MGMTIFKDELDKNFPPDAMIVMEPDHFAIIP